MESKITLSPEQMMELTIIKMDCSDASLCWVASKVDQKYKLKNRDEGSYLLKENLVYRYQYAYTLEDILNKLPTYIDGEDGWQLHITKHLIKYQDIQGKDYLKQYYGYSMMDNAFAMLKWVYENYPDKIKFLID